MFLDSREMVVGCHLDWVVFVVLESSIEES
jgi:hypothetical protein